MVEAGITALRKIARFHIDNKTIVKFNFFKMTTVTHKSK